MIKQSALPSTTLYRVPRSFLTGSIETSLIEAHLPLIYCQGRKRNAAA
jgi:hypothetical protein